jgi:hypothetical protein
MRSLPISGDRHQKKVVASYVRASQPGAVGHREQDAGTAGGGDVLQVRVIGTRGQQGH